MDPRIPTMRFQIKIHKQNHSIRSIINYRTAPSYKVAKYIEKKVNSNEIIRTQ